MPSLMLASTSPARRSLLSALGVPFRVEAPEVEETLRPGESARTAVAALARKKAHAVHLRHPKAWVLGADQLLEVEGHVLGKPADRDAARLQLLQLSGRTHELVTGVCLYAGA